MRNAFRLLVVCMAAVGAFGQGGVQELRGPQEASRKRILPSHYTSFPPQPTPDTLLFNPLTTVTEIPMWTYSVTAGADLGGGTYTGTIIGRSPYLRGKTTTTIPLQIVPVKVVINNGGSDTHTYDPSVNDGCVPTGHTAVDVVENSPIFTNTTWTMDGVNVGTTQYHDAFYRASFWSLVGGTSYHLVEQVSVLPEQTLYFGSVGNAGATLGGGTNVNVATTYGGCGFMGVVNVNNLQTAVNNLLASLSPTVNVGTLPMIIVDSVVSAETGHSITSSCCVLGFHSGFYNGANLQVTAIFDLDYSELFGNNDVTVISHELGEALFDPTTGNATPVWGSIGQDSGNCPGGQNNLEVGDPLSPGYPKVTNEHSSGTNDSNEWVVLAANGLTYHLQELALFSWFFGGTNLGIPGYYSDNGTLQGDAKLCSAGGGTN